MSTATAATTEAPAVVTPTPGQLRWHKEGHVGHIIFDNQKKFNAVNLDMWLSLPKAIAEFNADPDIRVVLLQGAGEKAFVSGADISQFDNQRSGDGAAIYNNATEAGYLAILACTKPVIAKIRGVCMGGGLGIVMNCDVRICADDAKFRMPAGRLGLGYGFSGLKRFNEVMGPANTADLFFSARIFGGADALTIGLVKQVVPVADFDKVVADYVKMICENAPLTLKAAKGALIEMRKPQAEQDPGRVGKLVEACFASDDYKEGRKAFAEKRVPNFQGK